LEGGEGFAKGKGVGSEILHCVQKAETLKERSEKGMPESVTPCRVGAEHKPGSRATPMEKWVYLLEKRRRREHGETGALSSVGAMVGRAGHPPKKTALSRKRGVLK